MTHIRDMMHTRTHTCVCVCTHYLQVRKLEHELGIPPEQLPLSGFKYLTRLHYCAPDTHTWGPNSEWGEHEMDYILFIR